jgi:hypothetical protein
LPITPGSSLTSATIPAARHRHAVPASPSSRSLADSMVMKRPGSLGSKP